ncbi:UNVERIFIED_CONTAM: hypothetical protein HDU68_011448 [Siphonaria sp. JEL0065]|nr:hypothetical protein HDU68_011448 [Siphonaria sp. JEL0065]
MVKWGTKGNSTNKRYSSADGGYNRDRDSFGAAPVSTVAPVNASLRQTLLSFGSISLAFVLTAFAALAPFAQTPSVASLGLINIEASSSKPADGILSAVLTVWGYCTTAIDGTPTCYPATDLKTIGNNSYNFQFNPAPLTNVKSMTVSQTLDILPYKTSPLLIFALPTVTIFLGIGVLSSLATLLFFFARNFSHAWVVCAKFTSTICLISWVVLLVCLVGTGVAGNGLVAFMANFQLSITASQSSAGLALMATALIADTAAMALSTWSCINAKKYDQFLDEKDQYEMEMAAAPSYNNNDRSLGRKGTGKKSRGSWEDDIPSAPSPRQRRDEERGGGGRGGRDRDNGRSGGRGRGNNNRGSYFNNRWSRRDSYRDVDSEAKKVGKDSSATAANAGPAEKSDWGILRTVNGVAGGVYGYFAGPAKPAEPEPEPEKKKGNAIKSASSKKRGGDRSPDRSRRNSPSRPSGSRSKSRGRNGSPDRRRR